MRTKGAAHHETREKILETARTLLLENGHERLSLREIAREAGFGPASLYEYFDGREAIIDALASRAAASLRRALARRSKDAGDERQALVEITLGYVAWAKAHKEDFLMLFTRLPSKRQAFDETSQRESPYTVVLEAVAGAHRAGIVSQKGNESVERLAYGLWALAHGMAMLELTHLSGFKADFKAADRAIAEAFVAGWQP